jgi:hypothetical protein
VDPINDRAFMVGLKGSEYSVLFFGDFLCIIDDIL